MPIKYIPSKTNGDDDQKDYLDDEFYRNLGPWTKIGDGLWAGPYQLMGMHLKHVST